MNAITTKSIGLTNKRMCYFIPAESYVEGRGFRVSIVIEGEDGHYPTGTWPYDGRSGTSVPWFWGPSYESACKLADEQNEQKFGLTKLAAFAIVTSSMAASSRHGDARRRAMAERPLDVSVDAKIDRSRRVGKCTACKHLVTWAERAIKLTDAFCPKCGSELARTTYRSDLPHCNAGPCGFTVAVELRARPRAAKKGGTP